jgi:segregation and condensation protein B
MIEIVAKIEALLFVNGGAMKMSRLAKSLDIKALEIKGALDMLAERLNVPESGIHLVRHEDSVELVTNPDLANFIAEQAKLEVQSELTRPQLETLTVIAYKGPISRAELEYIRGVNCQMILRNLAMRGLVEEKFDENILQNRYFVSNEFLKMLGLHNIEDLPRYEEFNKNEHIERLLSELLDIEN